MSRANQRGVRLLVAWAVGVVVAGGMAVATGQGDDEVTTTETTTTTLSRPDANAAAPNQHQIRVAGPVGSFRIAGSINQAVTLPLTFDVAERGLGHNGAEFDNVDIGGDASTITWDGGRPLVLSGTSKLDLDPAVFSLGEAIVRAEVGGTVAGLQQGDYRIDAPVAVGQAGLASSRDSVEFGATPASVITFKGAVSCPLSRAEYTFAGPGSVELGGHLTVERSDGKLVKASTVRLADGGQFELKLSPVGEGWIVTALLQGQTTSS